MAFRPLTLRRVAALANPVPLRLEYDDGSVGVDFDVSSAGKLTITPTAGQPLETQMLSVTGETTLYGIRPLPGFDSVRAPVEIYREITEADRVSGNANLLLIYADLAFAAPAGGGASFTVRSIPTVSGVADPGTTYIADFHGFWENTSGAGSMIACTGEVQVDAAATAGTSGQFVGLSGEVVSAAPSGTFAEAINIRAASVFTGAAGYTAVYGLHTAHTQSAGTTDNYYGALASLAVSGTGVVSNAYGFYSNISGAGTSFNFYAASAAPNHFGGPIRAAGGRIELSGTGVFGAGHIYATAADGFGIGAITGSATDFLLVSPGGLTILDVPTGTRNMHLYGAVEIDGALDHDGSTVGFYGVAPTTRQVLATGAGATVDNVIAALQTLGLVSQS